MNVTINIKDSRSTDSCIYSTIWGLYEIDMMQGGFDYKKHLYGNSFFFFFLCVHLRICVTRNDSRSGKPQNADSSIQCFSPVKLMPW